MLSNETLQNKKNARKRHGDLGGGKGAGPIESRETWRRTIAREMVELGKIWSCLK